ncbi:class I SAM-dependent methyltransferase [Oscillatoriales cyanobacterium LEGE 11467]|uniref:Class I SAM-dependent methyltransferase n=1 Tax=Zarconia navalis LEGE 11467 TaxID=1828826 RepID=A0A928Z7C0_9CYAN|nr:class I SAM-dependent methyltransferase [Zarconia navalis]MBE9039219.1 class I SAM-dependent methyltransferase [Zarconia navalis LEGE 11467]
MKTQIDTSAHPICPISGVQMKPWLLVPGDWLRATDNPFQLYWCEESQYGCLYPRPSASEIAHLYDYEGYYTHTTASRELDERSFLERLCLHIAWRLDRGSDLTADWFARHFGSTSQEVCEVGCGNGKLLGQLQAAGHTVIGVEPDAEARRLAMQNRGLQVFPGTAESMPAQVQSKRYDVVIMAHVLEHTLNPLLALENVMDLLKPNGKLVLETPNNAAVGLGWSGVTWFCLRVPEHLHFFTQPSLSAICEQVGLQVKASEFRGYCRQFSPPYIHTERQIWESLNSLGSCRDDLPSINSSQKAWLLLLRTIFAREEQKYDCVRVIAERQESAKYAK